MRREDREVAELALRRGWVTTQQVEEAIREQTAASGTTLGPWSIRPLCSVFVSLGMISGEQLAAIQDELRKKGVPPLAQRELLGQILLADGGVTAEAVGAAVAEQTGQRLLEGKAKRIGEILVERGACTVEKVLEALRKQRRAVLQCAGCRARFNVSDYVPAASYACPKCGALLGEGASRLDVDDTTVGIRPADASSLPPEVASEAGPKVHFGKFIVMKELVRTARGPLLRAWQNDRKGFVALFLLPPPAQPWVARNWVPEMIREAAARGTKIQRFLEAGQYEGRHYISLELIP